MKGIEKGSTNVYADLGMTDAGEMLVKAQLATKIAGIIKQRRMIQVQAAELLGVPQPKLSESLAGRMERLAVYEAAASEYRFSVAVRAPKKRRGIRL